MVHDMMQFLLAADGTSLSIVLIMSLIGSYCLGYAVTGPVVAMACFVAFGFSSLSALAGMRVVGLSFTQMRGGDAVIASCIGMTAASVIFILFYLVVARDRG